MVAPRFAQRVFPAAAASVRQAREFLATQLKAWDLAGLEWVAALVVSELATNCVLHANTAFTITLRPLADGAVRLEVTDGDRRFPRERHYGAHAQTGRGIALVADLSRRWGHERVGAGKVVWCELAVSADDRYEDSDWAAQDVDALLARFDPESEPEPSGADRAANVANTRGLAAKSGSGGKQHARGGAGGEASMLTYRRDEGGTNACGGAIAR